MATAASTQSLTRVVGSERGTWNQQVTTWAAVPRSGDLGVEGVGWDGIETVTPPRLAGAATAQTRRQGGST